MLREIVSFEYSKFSLFCVSTRKFFDIRKSVKIVYEFYLFIYNLLGVVLNDSIFENQIKPIVFSRHDNIFWYGSCKDLKT